MEYCLGFIFDEDLSNVLLMKKSKPASQWGKLNGVGGKVESLETHISAMVRETFEETGLLIPRTNWRRCGWMYGEDFEVSVFTARDMGIFGAKTQPFEDPIGVHPVSALENYLKQEYCIDNIPALVQLCILGLNNGPLDFTLNY